ncbi:MAG TPA: PEPxxWA-CTERM sorting domain-containing protein [Phenylobacterium sp.]|jgi:hypothetical protein
MNIRNWALGAVLATATISAASSAAAAIVDINAATNGVGSGNPVLLVLAAGSYSLTAIGIADGGKFDAWNPNSLAQCEGNACGHLWQWSFTAQVVPNVPAELNFIGNQGGFATALAALTAAQNNPSWGFGQVPLPSPPGVFTPDTFANPLNFSLAQTSTIVFNIFDGDGNYASNLGGVSLRITGVPEPTSWALMIGGFGLTGAVLRRRRVKPSLSAA